MIELHPNLLNLENELDNWIIIDPTLNTRRLNRNLDKPHVAEAYALSTTGYCSFERWEALQGSDFHRFPRYKAVPHNGRDLLRPVDADRTDWRWNTMAVGRPPKLLDFVCLRACHWNAYGNLALAESLFPDYSWSVICGDFHTTVICADERWIFDLNFAPSVLGVTAEDALKMVLKDEHWMHFDELEGNRYELSFKTLKAIEFFKLADNAPIEEEAMLAGMRELLEKDFEAELTEEEDLVLTLCCE